MCFASSIASAICSASKLRRRRSCLVVMVLYLPGFLETGLVVERIQDRLPHRGVYILREADQAAVRFFVGARRPLEVRHYIALETGALLVRAEERDDELVFLGERIEVLHCD